MIEQASHGILAFICITFLYKLFVLGLVSTNLIKLKDKTLGNCLWKCMYVVVLEHKKRSDGNGIKICVIMQCKEAIKRKK